MDDLRVDVVDVDQAGELLTLRRAAFVSEAQLYDDPNLPALTQSLTELIADLRRADVVTIGAWSGHRLVGTVRVELTDARATLGRFAVVPDLQGRGIGTTLLMSVMEYLPDETEEVWVFASQDSVQSLDLYAKQGFEHQHDQHTGDLTYAHLRRILGEVGEHSGDSEGVEEGSVKQAASPEGAPTADEPAEGDVHRSH